jgi:hypothetical protein
MRRSHEPDPGGDHPAVGVIEILDLEEETDPARGLLPDDGSLVLSVRSGQQQASGGAGRPYRNPPLRASVVRQREGILDELETQCAGEEIDRRVILVDHDGDEAEMHRDSIEQGCLADGGGRPVLRTAGARSSDRGPCEAAAVVVGGSLATELLAAAKQFRRQSGQGHRLWEIRSRLGAPEDRIVTPSGAAGSPAHDAPPGYTLSVAASLATQGLQSLATPTAS